MKISVDRADGARVTLLMIPHTTAALKKESSFATAAS
jgi:hypothetical protein